jgi:hypothetical protein
MRRMTLVVQVTELAYDGAIHSLDFPVEGLATKERRSSSEEVGRLLSTCLEWLVCVLRSTRRYHSVRAAREE